MRHLRTYENNEENKLDKGVWVYANPSKSRFALSKEWKDWMKTHLGEIVDFSDIGTFKYVVEYETNSFPEFINVSPKEIIAHSKNKEDLDVYIQAIKYNL